MPIEAASVHFLIGMCHSELGRPLGALDAFNNAIRVNPDFAEVFYEQRQMSQRANEDSNLKTNQVLAASEKEGLDHEMADWLRWWCEFPGLIN